MTLILLEVPPLGDLQSQYSRRKWRFSSSKILENITQTKIMASQPRTINRKSHMVDLL